MQKELPIGHDSRTIHPKHPCKTISMHKEGNKGTSKWPPGMQSKTPIEWTEVGNMALENRSTSQYRLDMAVFLNNFVMNDTWFLSISFHGALSFAVLINRASHTAQHAHTHVRFMRAVLRKFSLTLEHSNILVSESLVIRLEPCDQNLTIHVLVSGHLKSFLSLFVSQL